MDSPTTEIERGREAISDLGADGSLQGAMPFGDSEVRPKPPRDLPFLRPYAAGFGQILRERTIHSKHEKHLKSPPTPPESDPSDQPEPLGRPAGSGRDETTAQDGRSGAGRLRR